jgi:hypothetical protein
MSISLENISLFIPRVFANITKERIFKKFEELLIGKVSRVDLVEKISKSGEKYNSAYVHFDYWYQTSYAARLHASVRNPEEESRIIYDDPWFWIVLENKAASAPARKESVSRRSKTRINLTDFAEEQEEPPLNMEWKKPAEPSTEECVSYVKMVFDGEEEFDIEAQQITTYTEMDISTYTEMDYQIMGELEDMMTQEDMYQMPFDARYIHALEMENYFMRENMRMMEMNCQRYALETENYFMRQHIEKMTFGQSV